MESGSVAPRDFQPQLLHGLLQTPGNARAVMNAVAPGRSPRGRPISRCAIGSPP
ncbi:Scr1 family TA system antitoxin-like transcriptional regulator [Streptomyces sp. NBC_01506]|uniref:Scr1 family TA system antitoxin-like transcriptional regulator n=1 Tax=Streptomyces sp. NBC_01506 TaxID=2903887 RepID=UPI00386CF622